MADINGEVQTHLRRLDHDPSLSVNRRLLEDAAHIIPRKAEKADPALISLLASIILKPLSDIKPVVDLLVVLLGPLNYSEIISLAQPIDFEAALSPDAAPFNHLALSILDKAIVSNAHAQELVRQSTLLPAIVRLWLTTPNIATAEESSALLLNLLRLETFTDAASLRPAWTALYQDPQISKSIQSLSYDKPNDHLSISESQRTLAQARLLDWLPKAAALDWNTIVTRQFANDSLDGLDGLAASTLLDFVSHNLISRTDVLMHRCLVEYYSALLKTPTVPSTLPLDYLKRQGAHVLMQNYYLAPATLDIDPLDHTFLYGPAADYLAAFATAHPTIFLSDSVCPEVLTHLNTVLVNPRSADLHLLASLPRVCLLPDPTEPWSTSPLSRLSTKTQSADVLAALASVFTVQSQEVRYPALSPLQDKLDPLAEREVAAARRLLDLFSTYDTTFERDVEIAAQTAALPELAAAAGRLMDVVQKIRGAGC